MKLSIIIPVYNEKLTITEVLDKVKTLNLDKEIIVINDGSTDGTDKILDKEKDNGLVIIHNSQMNIGKGASIRKGLEYVSGDIIIIQDADLELSLQDYPKLLEPIRTRKAEIVYGSRLLNRDNRLSFYSFLANKFLVFFTNILYGASLTDVETGYKVFKKSTIENIKLNSRGFEWEVEITAKILRCGYRIYEVPVSYTPRPRYEGKKINWIDGLKALFYLFKYRFTKLNKITKCRI